MKILNTDREEIAQARPESVRRLERQGWRIRILSGSRAMVVGHKSAHIRAHAFGEGAPSQTEAVDKG